MCDTLKMFSNQISDFMLGYKFEQKDTINLLIPYTTGANVHPQYSNHNYSYRPKLEMLVFGIEVL